MVAQPIESPAVVRPSEATDMPAGLTPAERGAYVRGYARGCLTYTRKHGAPSVVTDGPAPAAGTPERRALAAQLRDVTTAHMLERQPTAHRAGMAALRKYRKSHGIAEPVAPRKPAARKPRKPAEPAAPVDVAPVVRLVPAPVAEPAPNAEDTHAEPATTDQQPTRTYRTRRDARRELADAMRARGEDPSDPVAWAAAKLAAGIR